MKTQSEHQPDVDDLELDPRLTELFARSYTDLAPDNFVSEVVDATRHAYRREMLGRLVLGLVVVMAMIPLQDAALELAALLMVQVIELQGGVVAALLAPVNSVGALLSLVLFAIRAAHRRLFVRG